MQTRTPLSRAFECKLKPAKADTALDFFVPYEGRKREKFRFTKLSNHILISVNKKAWNLFSIAIKNLTVRCSVQTSLIHFNNSKLFALTSKRNIKSPTFHLLGSQEQKEVGYHLTPDKCQCFQIQLLQQIQTDLNYKL